MFIKPYPEDEKIFRRLLRDGRTYTNDIKTARNFGRRYPDLINQDFLDIARIDKKHKTVFVTPPNVGIAPMKKKFLFFRKL